MGDCTTKLLVDGGCEVDRLVEVGASRCSCCGRRLVLSADIIIIMDGRADVTTRGMRCCCCDCGEDKGDVKVVILVVVFFAWVKKGATAVAFLGRSANATRSCCFVGDWHSSLRVMEGSAGSRRTLSILLLLVINPGPEVVIALVLLLLEDGNAANELLRFSSVLLGIIFLL